MGTRGRLVGLETVLGCGPALMLDGHIDVRPEAEGFHDPHVMGSTRRMGVGLTRDHRLLIVQTLAPVTFGKWAEVMRALGCSDAMNLDAGLARHVLPWTHARLPRPKPHQPPHCPRRPACLLNALKSSPIFFAIIAGIAIKAPKVASP